MFELFIARRYLSAKRKQVVISVITVISVIGVAAGVMALVIALAINNGFSSAIARNLLGVTAHVMIIDKDREGISEWRELAETMARIPHVKSAQPGLYDGGYISGPIDGSGAIIKGIPIQAARTTDALLHLKSGSLEGLAATPGEYPGIVLGAQLAERIGAVAGKPVDLLIRNARMSPFGPRPSYVTLRVAGIFESGDFEIDSAWAYMELAQTQKAFGLADVVNSIDIRLDDIYQASAVAAAAQPLIGPKLAATTWQEQYKGLLTAMHGQRVVTAITIGLILMVAALNILITLMMMVMEKHRDIAILMSMGTLPRQIRRIFVLEGALIGCVGTVIGLIAGYALSFLADRYHWVALNEQLYSLPFVPFDARWLDGVWISAVAIGVSLVATLYPARSATRIAPVEALRYE